MEPLTFQFVVDLLYHLLDHLIHSCPRSAEANVQFYLTSSLRVEAAPQKIHSWQIVMRLEYMVQVRLLEKLCNLLPRLQQANWPASTERFFSPRIK